MAVKIACQKKLTLIIVIFTKLMYLRYIYFLAKVKFFEDFFNTLNALNHKNIIITDFSGGTMQWDILWSVVYFAYCNFRSKQYNFTFIFIMY